MTSSTDERTPDERNLRRVRLRWTGRDMVFEGRPEAGGPSVIVDGGSKEGLAPMQLLLVSLAGCMAVDIRMILEKSRVPLDGLEIEVVGERAPEPPRRYLRIDMICHLRGPAAEHADRVQRAIDLSRDKYCSVLHTLDPGIALDVRPAARAA